MSDLISTTLNLLVDCAGVVYSLVGTEKDNEHILNLHREIQDVQAVVTSVQDTFKQKSIGAAMQRHIGELEKCISCIRAHIKAIEAKRQAPFPKKVLNTLVDLFDKKVHGNCVDVAETLALKERITKIKCGIAFELRAKSFESQSNLNEQMVSLLETLRQKAPVEYYELFKDIFESQKKLFEAECELQKKVVEEYRTHIDETCAAQGRLIEEKLDVVRMHADAFAQFQSRVEEKLQEHQALLTQMKKKELEYKEKVSDLKMKLAEQRIQVAELKNEILDLKKNMAAVHQRIDEMTTQPPVSLPEKICPNLNMSCEEITPDCIEILPVGTQFIFANMQSSRYNIDFKDCCGCLHFIQNTISLLETQYEERNYQHVSVDNTFIYEKSRNAGWPYFNYKTITGQSIVTLSHFPPNYYSRHSVYGYDGKNVYENQYNQVTQFRMFYYPNNRSKPNKLITYPTKESPDTLVKYVPINLKIFYILRIDEAFPEIGHFSFGLDYVLIHRKCNNRVDKNLFIDLLENPTCRHKFNESVEFYNSSGLVDSRLDIPNRTLFFYEDGKIAGAKKMTDPSIYFVRYT